jgi:23S rRNA pseudouridine1911/1915/1917 synthase
LPECRGFVDSIDGGCLRFDRYIANKANIPTRSQLKVRNAQAVINSKPVKLSFPVKFGDVFELHWDDAPLQNILPENIDLKTLYEDDKVIVVNKPQGMVVHPAAGNWSGTLVNALLGRCAGRNNCGGVHTENSRPFIVHRLDKDTSGVIIAAWDAAALAFLQEQFKARTVKKTYIAITRGAPREKKGLVSTKIIRDSKNRKRFTVSDVKGRSSITRYQIKSLLTMPDGAVYALLLLHPATGRTHQIRVHLKHLGCPVLGDPLYGTRDKRFPDATLALHALKLSIVLPGDKKISVFRAPVPKRFFVPHGLINRTSIYDEINNQVT